MTELRMVFWMLVTVTMLVATVAVGNWYLYSRVAKLEATHAGRATPQ